MATKTKKIPEWNTLHIFGYGDVQLVDVDIKKADSLKKLQPVIDILWKNKPKEFKGKKEYHVIHVFNNLFADWIPKEKGLSSFRINFSEIFNINELILELNQ